MPEGQWSFQPIIPLVFYPGSGSWDHLLGLDELMDLPLELGRNGNGMNGMPSAGMTSALSRIVHVTLTKDTLSIYLEDGRTISVPIGWYPRLTHGTQTERANYQISGAGFGIYWPDLDEDIGVGGLILGKKSTESATSFERWLQRRKND